MGAEARARPVLARAALAAAALLTGCSGGGGGGIAAGTPCTGDCTFPPGALTATDVESAIARAVGEAQARGLRAHVAVVDRVGNVLGVFSMTGAPATVAITSGLGVSGGLDGIPEGTVPATHAAIAKAITGAFLSSSGNAFSTRTASQIVQEHFNPNESQQPSGPLYGVQFSQLACSDVSRKLAAHGDPGPKHSPLGLAADPGGLPLYKDGVVVGGLGVEADGLYTLDRDLTNVDDAPEEAVAVAGSFGFASPDDIRGDRITADGRTFRYVDSGDLRSDPSRPPAFATLPGAMVFVDGYSLIPGARGGTIYGTSPSGVRADDGAFAAAGGWIVVDAANRNRFPPRDGVPGSLSGGEARTVLAEALAVAKRARAQIRRPTGSAAEVTIAVVDLAGDILGLVRTPDAPVFGIDVAVQKARTALFFSHPDAAAQLRAAPPAQYLAPPLASPIGPYADALVAFVGTPGALAGGVAWSGRAVGLLHRPTYPDGIADTPSGPLSKRFGEWSPFNVGLQLDLAYNQLVKGVLGDFSEGCAGRLPAGAAPGPDPGIARLRNGVQIFPGGVPIYRGSALVGAIGVSGDGVDQDDMVASLGLANAGAALASAIGHAPAAMRPDALAPQGTRLRYVQCPQSPFNGSTAQNACAGI